MSATSLSVRSDPAAASVKPRSRSGADADAGASVAFPQGGDERVRKVMDSVLAFVGVLSTDGTLLEANEPAVQAAGVGRDELIGRPFWDCYWWSFSEETQARLRAAVATAATGERVRYDAEVRVAGDGRIWIDFQLVPMLDEHGRVVELIPSGVDITERKHAEAHREFLLRELSHRVKNTLASIQSMAGQTLRGTSSPDEFRTTFGARLRAIAASHDLLVESNHENVRLLDLIRGQVGPYAADDARLVLEGDDLVLPGESAHALGLILHELATNAAKYGALSAPEGVVRIAWRAWDRSDMPGLAIDWRETGGPSVEVPERRGFGTRLIERSLATEGGSGSIDYAPEGVHARLELGLR